MHSYGGFGGFGGFGGGGGTQQRRYRGSDLRVKVKLNLKEISTGVSAKDVTEHGEDVVHGHASTEAAERTTITGDVYKRQDYSPP